MEPSTVRGPAPAWPRRERGTGTSPPMSCAEPSIAAAGSLVPPSSIVAGGPGSSLSLRSFSCRLQRHVRPLDPYKGGGRGRNNDGPTNYRRHATHVGDSRNCLSLCCCLEIDAAALLDLGHSGRHTSQTSQACTHATSLVKRQKTSCSIPRHPTITMCRLLAGPALLGLVRLGIQLEWFKGNWMVFKSRMEQNRPHYLLTHSNPSHSKSTELPHLQVHQITF